MRVVDILARKHGKISKINVLNDILEISLDRQSSWRDSHIQASFIPRYSAEIAEKSKKTILTHVENSARVSTFSVERCDPIELKILPNTNLTTIYNT
jgi:hypothetical protein